MNKVERWCVVVAILTTFLAGYSVGPVLAVTDEEPLREAWAPSEWGPDDKVGAVNRTTPEMVLKAVKLVKRGKAATLGKVYQPWRTWT